MPKYIYKSQLDEPSYEEQVLINLWQALSVYQSVYKVDVTEMKRQIMQDAPEEGLRV